MFDNRRDRDEGARELDGGYAPGITPGKVTLTQRIAKRSTDDSIADAVVQRLARGTTGAPLPVQLRGRFEQSLGADLGGVRVHTGGDAADAASAAGARAFALGQDVYFGSGHYDPDSDAGQHLLAHEVAHTVQQQGAEPVPQFALAVSQAGDASEAEADSAAAAMVAGLAAPRLSAAPVQRIARESAGLAVAPGMSVPSIDVIYEQIAHRIVYNADLGTADRESLTRWGYRPTVPINLPGDLTLMMLPSAREGVAPVLAFKGTLELVDWIEDMNSYGVGMFQFSRNEGAIHVALASLHGGATIIGHSLGGALAQITAAIYPELCSTVVTFQAPGIPQELIDGMRSRPEGRRITARHHVMTGDVVSHAGEGHLPGTRFTHTTTEDAIDPATAHRMMPLSDEASGAGVLDDLTGGPEVWNEDTPRNASAVSDVDRGESSAGWAEMGRHVGSGLAGDIDEEMYVQVWQAVRAAADAGGTRWSELWSMCEPVGDRAEAMRQNLQDLFPELSAAGAEEARVTAGELTSADSFVAAVDARRGGTLTDAQRTRVRAYYLVIPSRPAARTIVEPPREPGVMRLARGSVTPVDPSAIAARGVSAGGGALPHLDSIQASFGRHDVSGVAAHQGGAASVAARALDAHAYAFGGSVAFDGAPDLHTAAHEAAHVVQQRGGVQLRGDVSEPGDPHEVHADAVADAVVRGESAETLLDTYAAGGGSQSVQRLVRATGVDAVATVQRLLGIATVPERNALREELDRAITDAHSVGTVVEIGAAIGGEIYYLTLPIEDAIALRGECGPAMLPEPTAPSSEPAAPTAPRRAHGGPHRVTVTDLTHGFRTAVAAAIHTAGGLEGETVELEITLRVPIEGPLHLLGSLTLEVEHEAEGYHVTAEPHVGIGVGTTSRGELVAGVILEARGHDAYAATDLLALALEQELRAAASGPPPPFLVVILGSIALVAPEIAGAILVLDLAGRLSMYAQFGEPDDPLLLAIVAAVFGEGYEEAARARMRRGEFVESTDSASIEGHTETGGHTDRTEGEAEAGMSRHRRTEMGEDGALHDAHFDLVDIRLACELLGRFNAELEFHIDPDAHSRRGGVEIKVGLHSHHVAPAALIAGEVIVALIAEIERIRREHPETAVLRLPSADAVTGALGGLGMAMFTGSIPHAEMGIEFQLDIPANREEAMRVCLRIIEGGEGDETLAPVSGDPGEHPALDVELHHSREVWGNVGG